MAIQTNAFAQFRAGRRESDALFDALSGKARKVDLDWEALGRRLAARRLNGSPHPSLWPHEGGEA
jgi:hypothetical protein